MVLFTLLRIQRIYDSNVPICWLLFQVLAELKAKREKDLSRKVIFELDEEAEALNELTSTKNEISLPGEDLL